MAAEPITDQIAAAYADLPEQLQTAARYVLDNPRDVALLSMRQQARRAGVQPATMTRLAKRLGFVGFESVRSRHADAIRQSGLGFADKAREQVTTQKLKGDRALAAEMAAALADQLARLAEPASLDRLVAAANCLHGARRIFCLGLRSCHVLAWHVHYMLSLVGDRTVLLDQIGGVGLDPLRTATAKDVLFVASVAPYTDATVEATKLAASRGVAVLVMTDTKASPLVPLATHCLFATTASPSFLHSLVPALALGEMLATLAAGRGGDEVAQALRRTEKQLADFNVHWRPVSARRRDRG